MGRFSRVALVTAFAVATLGSATVATAQSPAAPAQNPDLKIGVVTDIGTVNDKNFNEYTFKGAQQGAAAVGAAEPPVTVPKDDSEYGPAIQAYVDQGFNVIVTAGFNLGVATTQAAHDNPDVWFIGVDQGPPCVTADGLPDTTFACAGDAATLLPNYMAVSYQEDQAGYLAGIVAASVSQNGVIGAIGGTSLCGPCVRYIQGYELGAKSVNPDIKVVTAYATNDFSTKAFNDPNYGKTFAQTFIATQKPDVLFQVAGKTGNGVLDAACEAGIHGVGVDVDQALSYPNAAACIVTSATKALELAVSTDIKQIVAGTAKGGDDHWDATRDGIGVAPFHDLASVVPADVQQKLDDAYAAMKAGTLQTCPENCGKAE
jgi:basic membrane protein A and related proteins